MVGELAHTPFGWHLTTLQVGVRRYQCTGCAHVWRQDLIRAASPRSCLSRGALRWMLEALVVNHLSMTRIAAGLEVAWNTANDAVLVEGQRLLIYKPAPLAGVSVVGIDEHVWPYAHKGDKYVTVTIDLTPVSTGAGQSRLIAIVEGRSKHAFKTWLAAQPRDWREGIRTITIDGFTGFKTATVQELPTATTVMGPFHVIHLAGDAMDFCRRRVQLTLHRTRRRKDHPLTTTGGTCTPALT